MLLELLVGVINYAFCDIFLDFGNLKSRSLNI